MEKTMDKLFTRKEMDKIVDALQDGNLKKVLELTENGKYINCYDEGNRTALMIVSSSDEDIGIKTILKVDGVLLNSPNGH
jgi:hypothetical protein